MNSSFIPPDAEERRLISEELDRNIIVEAAAGTGKTTSLVRRMINLLRQGKCEAGNLVAITFTRKAQAELRTRFRIELEKEAAKTNHQLLRKALDNLEKCYIGTIHSFCARLLRERPVEAMVGIPFEEIEPEEDLLLKQQCWEEFIFGLAADDPGHLLDGLDALGVQIPDLYQSFINFTGYPDISVWPADDVPPFLPDDIKTISTDINAYVQHMAELRPRLPEKSNTDTLIPFYRDFPDMLPVFDMNVPLDLYRILRFFDRELKLTQKEWTADGNFTKEEAKEEKGKWDRFREQVAVPALRRFRAARYKPAIHLLKSAFDFYTGRKAQLSKLNFEDLLIRAADLLKNQPHVRKYFRRMYTHLLVDEFQDTDPVQALVMLYLTASDPAETDFRKCSPIPGSLFIVGDPKQSIYRFRRADIITYNEVKQIVLKSGTGDKSGLFISLSSNFRSTAAVRDWVNTAFTDKFPPGPTSYSPVYVPMQKGRDEAGEEDGCIYRITIPKDSCRKNEDACRHEAARIADYIRYMIDHPGKDACSARAPSDFMIITPKRENLDLYALALKERGIPCTITGGTTMNDLRELRLLRVCLKAVINPDDETALAGTLRSELFGASDVKLYQYKKAGGNFSMYARVPESLNERNRLFFRNAFSRLKHLRSFFSQMPATAALEKTIAVLGLMPLSGSGQGGYMNAGGIARCIELVRKLRDRLWSPATLIDFLDALIDRELKYDGIPVTGEAGDVVRIMNLHQAKGLEAKVVFLSDPSGKKDYKTHRPDIRIDRSTGDAKGYLEIRKREGFKTEPVAQPADWETHVEDEIRFLVYEDIRLLYVAATRAKSVLTIVCREGADTRNFWTEIVPAPGTVPELPDYGEQHAPDVPAHSITIEEIQEAEKEIAGRRESAEAKTFELKPAKGFALKEFPRHLLPLREDTAAEAEPVRVLEADGKEGEHGIEWGEVIHRLLEIRVKQPAVDCAGAASSLFTEYNLDPAFIGDALTLVASVEKSEVLKRAMQGTKLMSEVPFSVLLPEKYNTDLPTLVRGVIDLVFLEPDGWVIIDYKTDAVTNRKDAQKLVRHYTPQLLLYSDAWFSITGEKVKEAGLFFTAIGEYAKVF